MKDLVSKPSTITVKVFTRHSAGCPKKNDPNWKRCKCRKSLYIYVDGKVTYKSAKTRSWERAERLAQEERDARDPIKIKERELDERKAAKLANAITIVDALDRWLRSQKKLGPSNRKSYCAAMGKITRWAQRKGIIYLKDVTASLLDEWRGEWSPDAKLRDDRLNGTSQAQLQGKIKSFFEWAVSIELIDRDPSRALRPFKQEEERTCPLTQEQYQQLLDATDLYDGDCRRDEDKFGHELRVIFQVQGWTGLRIVDVLKMARSNLTGNPGPAFTRCPQVQGCNQSGRC